VNDDQIEALLGRYRPITNVPPLARAPRTWPWAVAAAALLVFTLGSNLLVSSPARPDEDARERALAARLGGGLDADVMAAWLVRTEGRAGGSPAWMRAEVPQ